METDNADIGESKHCFDTLVKATYGLIGKKNWNEWYTVFLYIFVN